jgi:hypothetical protein
MNKIFISCFIFLVLQYAVVGIVGYKKSEPWPALVLPAFKSVYSTDDLLYVDQLEFYVENNKNGQLIEVYPGSLFQDVNKSQLQGFLRTHFKDSLTTASFNANTRQWLKKRLKQDQSNQKICRLTIRWVRKMFSPTQNTARPIVTKMQNQFTISLHE